MYWVVRTDGDPLRVADAARGEVRRLDKDIAASSTRSIRQLLDASVGSRRFNADLINAAGAASLLLALIGVYSVAAFSVERRTREIGLRLTLGAMPVQVLRHVLAAEWRPIAAGLAAGIVGAMFASRALAPILFQSTGVDPVVIATAAAILGLAALGASMIPARRAMTIDPIAALKTE